MSDDQFLYAKTGFAPYADGSGFKITTVIEQETEEASPTISIEMVGGIEASEWIEVGRKIERLLDILTRQSPHANGEEQR